VPLFPPKFALPALVHPTPAATITNKRAASGANPHRFCVGTTKSSERKPASEVAAAAQGQLPWNGRFIGGRFTALVAAVVAMFIVAVWGVVEPKLRVLLGVKVTTGKSTAPEGPEIEVVKAAVPLKPSTAFNVTVPVVVDP
jgi:hypothetical protein